MVEKVRRVSQQGDRRIEDMPKEHIGLFGAQGHLGTALVRRFEDIKPSSAKILGTADKDHNPEIAARSNLVVVSV
ncbi:hypothetical protein HYW59_04810 [Candidatus Kaiserbacteria bacterium]|nr:hypothetical protein [Candidatus Kaiserbacteria bacterium]